ncbi:hypothetical protein RQP46_000812 [Phenoliferia psychrophenolica]
MTVWPQVLVSVIRILASESGPRRICALATGADPLYLNPESRPPAPTPQSDFLHPTLFILLPFTMRFTSTSALLVTVLGLISSATAISHDKTSNVAHIIKSRQAHVGLKSPKLQLQKRADELVNDFTQLNSQLTPHLNNIKSMAAELHTATPERCAILGPLINSGLTSCCGLISACWGPCGWWKPCPPRPSGGGGGGGIWFGGSCFGAAQQYSTSLQHFTDATDALTPVLHKLPQHAASITATVATAHDEFSSLLDGTNAVLPGLTTFVRQL